MAQIHPHIDELAWLATPLNEGEVRVLEVLQRLDDDWHVFVQPRLGLDRPDFVVGHPQLGITVVEVKDWALSAYRMNDGVIEMRSGDGWKPTTEVPRRQADRYRKALTSRLEEAHARAELRDIRGVVVFPLERTSRARSLFWHAPTVGGERYIEVYGWDDLDARVLDVVTGGRRPQIERRTADQLDALRRVLVEPEWSSDLRMPVTLADAARNIEMNPSNAKRRRVKGTAGCGKSVGLAARAARLAAERREVLVVTFNTTLVPYLQGLIGRRCREIGSPATNVTVTHFHALCRHVVDEARTAGHALDSGVLPGTLPEDDLLVIQAASAFRAGFGPQFDAVLVDEGQDFQLEWWNMLRHHVCRRDGEMLLVADLAQDIYDRRSWVDENRMSGAGFSGPWTVLNGSYRLPDDLVPIVTEFASAYVQGDAIVPTLPTDGTSSAAPTVRRWVNSRQGPLGITLGEEVVALLRSQPDLSPDDVVFLANSHDEGMQAVSVITAAGYPVHHLFTTDHRGRTVAKRGFSPLAPGVKGCTFHSFKGWEARAVVMTIGRYDADRRAAYVGLTRVKGDRSNRSAFITVVNGHGRLNDFRDRFERTA